MTIYRYTIPEEVRYDDRITFRNVIELRREVGQWAEESNTPVETECVIDSGIPHMLILYVYLKTKEDATAFRLKFGI